MYKLILIISSIIFLNTNAAISQIKTNISFSNNGKGNVQGIGANVGYEFMIGKRLITISQIGAKFLNQYDDWLDGNLKNNIFELHQTVGYKLIKNPKYSFIPSLGLNYRYFIWESTLNPPYNSLPIRGRHIEFRNGFLSVSSIDGKYRDDKNFGNIGFTFQLINNFKLSNKIGLEITPFFEDDYDGSQTVIGVYAGIRYKLKGN